MEFDIALQSSGTHNVAVEEDFLQIPGRERQEGDNDVKKKLRWNQEPDRR